jgi:hypothetical protein
MNADTYIKMKLAETAIQEGARHGGSDNMVSVAFVMKNRVEAGWYGGDWMPVLEQAKERAGTTYPTIAVNLRDPSIRQLLQRIDDIYDGSEDFDLTDKALFYCELHRVDGQWFKQNVLKNREEHPMVATVGPVTFFR